MSTAGADVVEQLASRFPHLLAAPIVGSIPAIEAGTASILVGGDAADYGRAEPVLRAFGEPIHVATRRQAVALKLVTNAMFGVCSAVAAELQGMGERAGLEAEAVFGLLERTMPYLKARKRGYVDHDHSAPLFFIKDMVKDLDLALALAHRSGAAMPLLAIARELYAEVALERPTDEITALIERY
jgi:3-hydroxyisobutyrate dehydrogenase-like beta-hydroxyacid dehydrogenase